jgi:2-C-methyl-D-erythritol 4-phosphate cytidylyltransferase
MPVFSIVLLTAVPTSHGADGAGAFVKVDGRECLLRSVELFLNRDNVKQIQLVVAADAMEEAKRKYGGHLGFSGVKLITGGKTWLEQIAAAAEKISPDCSHVLLHDAARPAVAFGDMDAIMTHAEKHPIVALAASVRGGLVELDDSGKPLAFHAGQRFLQLVTPWAFRKDKFLEMAANKREPAASEVWLLRSSPLNMRVGYATDAALAKIMINMLPKPKIRAADNPFEEAQW